MNVEQLTQHAIELLASGRSDDQVAVELEKRGASPEHARAAIAFVPMAFAHATFAGKGPTLSRTYVVDGDERFLAEHPLFIEALAQSRQHSGEIYQAVVVRSAELNALNNAVNSGSSIEDCVFSSTVLSTTDAGGLDLSTNSVAYLALESERATELVNKAFTTHDAGDLDISVAIYSGFARESACGVQLDVRLCHQALGDRAVLESCGGAGKGVDDAVDNAIAKFIRSSLHALLTGVVDPSIDPSQVEVRELGGWRVIAGPLVGQMEVPSDLRFADVLDGLLERWLRAGPSREIHWMRVFYMRAPDQVYGCDVLVDNEPWAEGLEHVTSWSWPKETSYGIRIFLVLVPAD